MSEKMVVLGPLKILSSIKAMTKWPKLSASNGTYKEKWGAVSISQTFNLDDGWPAEEVSTLLLRTAHSYGPGFREAWNGESPWELEALQSWWLNSSDKVSQHTITGYKLFVEYNEGSVTVTHDSWPTLTQNHTRKEILGTSIQPHKHPRWPRKGWYPLFLLPSSGPCSIIMDAAGLTLSLYHPPVHHS